MANNLSSNVTEDLARIFMDKFEASRVLTKGINNQLLTPRLTPSTGGTVSFKRPHDYNTISTADGDISSSTKSDILAGKATGTVQNYLTVATEWGNLEQALDLDQLDEIIAPMATRMVTDLELNLGAYMTKNAALVSGTPGTVVDAWTDVADANALMHAVGVPADSEWCYVMSPFTATALASVQTNLSVTPEVNDAWRKAQVTNNFAGMNVLQSNAIKTYTSGASADRAGTLSGTPTATYASVKDTMTQTLSVTAFTGSGTVKAGDVVQVTGRNRVSNATREVFLNRAGSSILWSGTVTADVILNGSGAGDLVVSGPAIFEANGQYNTVDSALASGDVITLLGGTAEVRSPSLFFHKDAFGIGTVKLPKLSATDTVATTEDGFSIRVTRYSDGDKNKQMVRFDMVPAFICFNPFFAGQGFGS